MTQLYEKVLDRCSMWRPTKAATTLKQGCIIVWCVEGEAELISGDKTDFWHVDFNCSDREGLKVPKSWLKPGLSLLRVTQGCQVRMWTCNELLDVCLECWPEDHQHLLWQEATNLLLETSSEGSSQTEGEVFLCLIMFFYPVSCLYVGWLVGFSAVLHKNYLIDFYKTLTRNGLGPE